MSRRSARPLPTAQSAAACPCGLDRDYADCCGSLHAGRRSAPTAEALMRSRFSAFVVQDEAYLLRSWHSTTRPACVEFDRRQRWTGLTILRTSGGSLLRTEGTVEFHAAYTVGGRAEVLAENSRFLREAGSWVYLGPIPTV